MAAVMGAEPASAQMADNQQRYYPADKFNLDQLPDYDPKQTVSGTIRIWGSGYIASGNTTRYWEAGFRKYHPDVKFEYHLGDSLTAVPSLYTGASDLGSGPRISWNDLKAFNHTLGYDPLQIMVMTGSYNVLGWNPAFAIFVNKVNPVESVTLKQLDGIFGRARAGGWVGIEWHPELARGAQDDIRTWGQLGLDGDWKNKPVHVYATNPKYGVSTTISNQLIAGSDAWNETVRIRTNIKDAHRPDGTYLAVEQIADDVKNDIYGIGYSSVAFAGPKIKALAVASTQQGPYVKLTLDSVHNRSYPLVDESYLYLNRVPGAPVDPKLKEYLSYILSRQGQADVARDGKYLPLTADMAAEQRQKLN